MKLADAAATEMLGDSIAPLLRTGDLIAVSGTLGAGKTTFARGLLRGLGLEDEAASPTFPIVIAYEPPEVRLPIWHVDLYRIQDAAEIEELGLGEALMEGALLVEWPEQLPEAMLARALRLDLAVVYAAARALTVHAPAAWESRWPPA